MSLRLEVFCHFGVQGSCVGVVILCDAMEVRGVLLRCKYSVIDYDPPVHKAKMPVVVADSTLGSISFQIKSNHHCYCHRSSRIITCFACH